MRIRLELGLEIFQDGVLKESNTSSLNAQVW
jgi:hypothetical protein